MTTKARRFRKRFTGFLCEFSLPTTGASSSASGGDGERETDGGAETRTTFDPDTSAVALDNSFRDGKAETGAFPVGSRRLPVTVENPRQILFRDADSGVSDSNDDIVGISQGFNDHSAAH